MLLTDGVPIDGRIRRERARLHAFAYQGDHKTVAWLFTHGADVNARDSDGETPLEIAQWNGKRRLIDWLACHARARRSM